MASVFPWFLIIFWISTPLFIILLAFFSYKDFKWWKILIGISAYSYLCFVSLFVERFSDSPPIIVAALLITGIIALFTANKLKGKNP